MNIINKSLPFFITDVQEHLEVKEKVLNDIYKMGEYSFINETQRISSTDWHLNNEFNREYINHLINIFNNVCNQMNDYLKSDAKLEIRNYWYQLYRKGDYHKWHEHFFCAFSNIYYLSLPEDSVKTSFRIGSEEFEVDVKEGQILSFPGIFTHCSKENTSDKEKVVIVFNCG